MRKKLRTSRCLKALDPKATEGLRAAKEAKASNKYHVERDLGSNIGAQRDASLEAKREGKIDLTKKPKDSKKGEFLAASNDHQNDVNEDGDNDINVGSKARSLEVDFDDDGSRGIKSSNNLIASCVNIGPDDCLDFDLEIKQNVLEVLATAARVLGVVASHNAVA